MNHLFGKYADIFSKAPTETEGDSIWIEKIWNEEEEAENEKKYAKTSICDMVTSFIKDTTNEAPYKGQLFSLSELQQWVVKEFRDRNNGTAEVKEN